MLGHARSRHCTLKKTDLKIKARDDATPEAGGDVAAGLRTLELTMLPLASKSLRSAPRAYAHNKQTI